MATHEQLSTDGRPAAPLSIDTCHKLLADDRRRAALRHLLISEEPVEFEDLVTAVATSNERADRTDLTVCLHHLHLPKLERAGVIETDDEGIRTTEQALQLGPFVQ